MFFAGVEHGTRSIRCTIIDNVINDDDIFSWDPDQGTTALDPDTNFLRMVNFQIPRNQKGEKCFPELLKEFIPVEQLGLLCLTHGMGDGFDTIAPLTTLKDRGVLTPGGTGRATGAGAKVFDDILNAELPALAVPGMHRCAEFLDARFRRLHSHSGAPDKICSSYAAYRYLKTQIPPPYLKEELSFVNADVGANTVSTLVVSGKLVGAIDACAGAPGLFMGPLDLARLRELELGATRVTAAFEQGGVFEGGSARGLESAGPERLHRARSVHQLIQQDPEAEERLEALAFAVAMEMKGLTAFAGVDAFIISGAGAGIGEPFSLCDQVSSQLGQRVHGLDHFSASKGAALMARDIHGRHISTTGQSSVEGAGVHILGVPVDARGLKL